jgi:hypothetical protein
VYDTKECKDKGYVNDMTMDIKPKCFDRVPCTYENINKESYDCEKCHKQYETPHRYCCLNECGEHEFCRSCSKGIYLNKSNNNDTKPLNSGEVLNKINSILRQYTNSSNTIKTSNNKNIIEVKEVNGIIILELEESDKENL